MMTGGPSHRVSPLLDESPTSLQKSPLGFQKNGARTS